MQTLELTALQKEYFLSVVGCSEQGGSILICRAGHRSKAQGGALPLGQDRLGLPIFATISPSRRLECGSPLLPLLVLTSLLGGCELPLSLPQFPHL